MVSQKCFNLCYCSGQFLSTDIISAISNANVNQHSNLTVGEQLPEIKSAPVNPRQVTKPSSQHGALSTKNSTKPQDLMVTAFDLSEESSTDGKFKMNNEIGVH